MITIDGSGLILGRVASRMAKKLLQGEEVHIINAEKLILTGNPQSIIDNYRVRRRLQNKGTPEHSPVWPKVPSMLVRRIIRGMLPWKSSRGKQAFKRLRVYISNPKNLKVSEVVDDAGSGDAKRFISISELCKELGYTK